MISDTSSDYDSLSNVGSRRPQSFVLDDDYDIITEEEAAESIIQEKVKEIDSSYSGSEGPDCKDASNTKHVTAPPEIQTKSSFEDKEQDGEMNGISDPNLPVPSSLPFHTNPSLLSHVIGQTDQPSSISVDLATAAVINTSNTLEEIDPLVKDEHNSHFPHSPKHIQFTSDEKQGSNISTSSDSSPARIESYSSISSSIDQTPDNRDGHRPPEDLKRIDTKEEISVQHPTKSSSPFENAKTHPEICTTFDSIKVKNVQDILEGISNNSFKSKTNILKPDSSFDVSSDSHTTVRQVLPKHQDSTSDSSDNEISSLQEKQEKSLIEDSSESEFACQVPITDSSDYEIHSTIYLDKKEDHEPNLSPKEKATLEAFVKPSLEDGEDTSDTHEHKPIPLKKELIKISSSDLLHRQIKEDMIEQVMSQEDDSLMSESTIKSNVFQSPSENFIETMTRVEDIFLDSGLPLGQSQNSKETLESDSLQIFELTLPVKSDVVETTISVQQAIENDVEEPEWELIEPQTDICKEELKEQKELKTLTPEQALEVATDIVLNVQSEALKKYEELIKTNQLPKVGPDSKFTPETKEKVQEYLKELEESEQYDVFAAELIHNVATKKEEKLRNVKKQEISIDITDDDIHKSDAMLDEFRNELRRNSISVTDEDLTTEITHELLAEKILKI